MFIVGEVHSYMGGGFFSIVIYQYCAFMYFFHAPNTPLVTNAREYF